MLREEDRVLADALKLPPDVRARLAGQLLESLDDGQEEPLAEVERAWAEEIERRVAAVDRGEEKILTWAEMQEHQARLFR